MPRLGNAGTAFTQNESGEADADFFFCERRCPARALGFAERGLVRTGIDEKLADM